MPETTVETAPETDARSEIAAELRPDHSRLWQGAIVWGKFAPGYYSEGWTLLAVGISHDPQTKGAFRWYLPGYDSAWEFDAVEACIVIGDRADAPDWVIGGSGFPRNPSE